MVQKSKVGCTENLEGKEMKATVEHEFGGCHDDCPYFKDFGTLSPEYCEHPSFTISKKIVGYSSRSCEIPIGKDYPDWCPVAKEQI
jgi:hypothetical protein